MRRHHTAIALGLSLAAPASLAISNEVKYQVLLESGAQVPGLPGHVVHDLAIFERTATNTSGHTLFRGKTRPAGAPPSDLGRDALFYASPSGGLRLLAASGHLLPFDGGNLQSVDDWFDINDAGDVVFEGAWRDHQNKFGSGAIAGQPDRLQIAVRSGEQIPDAPEGVKFGRVSFLSLNHRGELVFNSNGDAGISAPVIRAVVAGKPGNVRAVAVQGQPAPGTDHRFKLLNYAPVINDRGAVAFKGILDDDPSNQSAGVWAARDGVVENVGHTNGPAPGTSGDMFASMDGPTYINNAGAVAFRASLQQSGSSYDSGSWIGVPRFITPLRLEGDAAPGTNARFLHFNAPHLNDDGQVVFTAAVDDPANGQWGVWAGRPDQLRLVVRQGHPISGASFPVDSIVHERINALGQVAIGAFGPQSLQVPTAVLATDLGGQLHVVAAKGNQIEVNGQLRTIEMVFPFGGFDLSDSGFLSFSAEFTDGTSAVLLAKLPTGKLDLGDDHMSVRAGLVDHVRTLLIAGRSSAGGVATGKWNGVEGITSSIAANSAIAGKETLSVGYAPATDSISNGFNVGMPGAEMDEGSQILIRLTRNADANLDGIVNNNDITILAGNYRPGEMGKHWYQADFNYDGEVNNNDITILAGFYDPSAPALSNNWQLTTNNFPGAVPEPSLPLSALLATTLVYRRPRR